MSDETRYPPLGFAKPELEFVDPTADRRLRLERRSRWTGPVS